MTPTTIAALGGLGSTVLKGLGGLFGSFSQSNAQRREYERQKEFAQNGIRWRVADAKAAGLHPLAALGVNSSSYSPQAAVGSDYGLSEMGQDISRAIEAKQTKAERENMANLQNELAWQQVENAKLQNRQLRQEIDMAAMQFNDSKQAVKKQQQVPYMPPSTTSPSIKDSSPKLEQSDKYQWWQTSVPGVWDIGVHPDYKQIYEDVPIVEITPLLESMGVHFKHKVLQKQFDGRIYSPAHAGWIDPHNKKLVNQLADYYKRIEVWRAKRAAKSKEILERH